MRRRDGAERRKMPGPRPFSQERGCGRSSDTARRRRELDDSSRARLHADALAHDVAQEQTVGEVNEAHEADPLDRPRRHPQKVPGTRRSTTRPWSGLPRRGVMGDARRPGRPPCTSCEGGAHGPGARPARFARRTPADPGALLDLSPSPPLLQPAGEGATRPTFAGTGEHVQVPYPRRSPPHQRRRPGRSARGSPPSG